MANPNPTHKFPQGNTGNPKGRPKEIKELKALAREHTKLALDVLVEIAGDTTAQHGARVTAASAILDRGYGKPTQHIEANVSVLDQLSTDDLATLDAVITGLVANSPEGDPATLN